MWAIVNVVMIYNSGIPNQRPDARGVPKDICPLKCAGPTTHVLP